MKLKIRRSLLCCAIGMAGALLPAVGADVDVVLLGGQSNADGRADSSDLPSALQGVQADVLFYHGNADGKATVPGFTLTNLQPGGSSMVAGQFGPEVALGRRLAQSWTGRTVAIVKYGNGGTSLAVNWAPGTGADDRAFTNTVTRGLQALRAAGHTPRVVAMAWMQGETDGGNATYAAQYEANMNAFIARVRALYGTEIRFVIGQIHNGGSYPNASWLAVQQAQQHAADTGSNVAMVVTHDLLPLKSDNLHYTAAGLVALGERFADAIMDVTPTPPGDPARQLPLLYYPFDADCRDASGLGNHGVVKGAAAVTHLPGEYRLGAGGLELTGADDTFVQLTTPIAFAATNAWSVAFWCQRDELVQEKGMIIGETATTDDFIWLNDKNGGLRFRNSSAQTYDFVVARDLAMHHYALVANGAGSLSVYTDGQLRETRAGVTTTFRITAVGLAYPTTTLHYALDGSLDELYVYGRALASNEVYNLYSPADLRGLLLYYPFDADCLDASGLDNHGVAVGSAAITATAGLSRFGGGALTLDGDGDRVQLSSAIGFATNEAWSVSVWARLRARGNEGMLIGERATTDDFMWLNTQYSGFRFRSSAATTHDFAVTNNTGWHHHVLVADGAKNLTLYADNYRIETKTGINTSFKIDTVGWAYNGNTYEFDGQIDEVRVYARALGPADVSLLFNPSQEVRLVLHYPFDADYRDLSGQANDGVPAGAPAITGTAGAFRFGAGGVELDGNSWLTLSRPIRFASWAPWSVAFWARRDVITADGMVIGERGTTDDFIWLNSNYNGLRFRATGAAVGAGADFTVAKDTALHHYVLAADGKGNLTLYVDGVLNEAKIGQDTGIVLNTVGSAYSADMEFDGCLDEIRVYEGTLTAEQAGLLYASNSLVRPFGGMVLIVR